MDSVSSESSYCEEWSQRVRAEEKVNVHMSSCGQEAAYYWIYTLVWFLLVSLTSEVTQEYHRQVP